MVIKTKVALRKNGAVIFMKCSTKREVKSSRGVDAIKDFKSKKEHLFELPIFGNFG